MTPQSGNRVSTSVCNSGLCWTVCAGVSAEPFSHVTGTLRCLQKEIATYRHWSVSLWRDPDDVPHCRILSPDKTEWRLISNTLCGWRRWPVMVHDTHKRRRRLCICPCSDFMDMLWRLISCYIIIMQKAKNCVVVQQLQSVLRFGHIHCVSKKKSQTKNKSTSMITSRGILFWDTEYGKLSTSVTSLNIWYKVITSTYI